MTDANKALAQRWFEEVWNQKRPEAITELYHVGGRSRGLPEAGSQIEGPEGFKEVQKRFLTAFPDLHVTVETMVCEGNWVAVRWTAKMTHLGHGYGFAPTGKELVMPGSSFMRFEAGQIIEGHNQMDFTGLREKMRQSVAAAR